MASQVQIPMLNDFKHIYKESTLSMYMTEVHFPEVYAWHVSNRQVSSLTE